MSQRFAIVHGASEDEVHADLWEAVRLELHRAVRRAPISLSTTVSRKRPIHLIPEQLRAEAHLRIGRLLAAHTPRREARRGDFRDRQPAQPRRSPDHLTRRTRAAR